MRDRKYRYWLATNFIEIFHDFTLDIELLDTFVMNPIYRLGEELLLSFVRRFIVVS
jgi:hypothetical protein